ncbi:MAG TPA: cobaltochelatase subunit CobN [Methylomirabilota bacterium]|nr:cobaltochelatase subunit CobN [Methylomirabilota bacterium]
MHLLAAKPGVIADGSEAVDLGQTPGDIVFLSAADTELACLSQAQAQRGPAAPTVRLANLLFLGHNLSVDKYADDIVRHARLVIVRLLGGVRYWPYGVEQLSDVCRRHAIPLALLPGDDQPDPELSSASTLPPDAVHRLWQYCVHGGGENARNLLSYATTLIGRSEEWREPAELLRAGLYWPSRDRPTLAELQGAWRPNRPVAALVFYRALLQSGDLAVVDALIERLAAEGLNPLPVYAASLKEPIAAALLRDLFAKAPPAVILNATAFALSQPGAARTETPFDAADCPVLQVVFASGSEVAWRAGTGGLSARDIAMHVALPEIDGRVLSRAVSFKAEARVDPLTECPIVVQRPLPDRVAFVAQLAAAWARLRATPAPERRIAIVLANYPNRDGRIGNGVGLDTPAGVIEVLRALCAAGYSTEGAPDDGAALMQLLLAGPTNRASPLTPTLSPDAGERGTQEGANSTRFPLPLAGEGQGEGRLSVQEYCEFFASLPKHLQSQITDRWGAPERDPFFAGDSFRLPAHRFGNVVVAIQPARGYNIDSGSTYHSPDLVPPHGYLAFYAWLRRSFDAHAVIHMGKHGNLEWLPGKALALSAECWPEAALGPLPHLYPFIVNDPGEGAQAKRRSAAVIVDHLTPPLTRAESYGPLRDLEQLVDEYYEAAGLDPRRCRLLRERILELAASTGLDKDCGVGAGDDAEAALGKLDNHLCELKELQIRDGLHVFGVAPAGEQLTDLLVALTRLPRARGEGRDASLIRALAADLNLDFDPLNARLGDPWAGPRPPSLRPLNVIPAKAGIQEQATNRGHWTPAFAGVTTEEDETSVRNGDGHDTPGAWRTIGDTVERLELLAKRLVADEQPSDPNWIATRAVLDFIERELRPTVARCGEVEIAGLLAGLDGRFVAPGPSGAPTRGRLDVLPTGRNFYSVDTRAVPTPTAWQLGWKSAALLLERYRQDHGAWPESLALSAWGTANMRTGGDDIAQALALMGVRPTWDNGAGRVSGFEILPLSILDRPRVDVTLRVSGFFRDAFLAQIDLVDSAARAVAALDEPPQLNPLAARARADVAAMTRAGIAADVATKRAGFRVFGSKPGAYGAGLQALIDERGWETGGDLARAYIAWGGYAYGAGAQGAAEHKLFESRLTQIDGVLHNQDNREHDLLDSDDYYQFEGGLAVTVKELTGRRPPVYHNDHSRPEAPKVRTLDEEIARVVRARVVNPKWIRGVMRHGYKGVFEMAATVDYMFAFAATAGCVADHHFDAVFDAYIADESVLGFMLDNNPNAAREMAERLIEAQDRGLWRPRSNAAHGRLAELARGPA